MISLIIFLCACSMFLIIYQSVRSQRVLARYLDKKIIIQAIVNFSRKKAILKTILLVGAVIGLGVALTGPRVAFEQEARESSARDVVIVFDISRSMAASDCEPNRLAYAKKKVKDLLHVLKATRVALVLFAGDALVACPLTDDFDLFNLFLQDLQVGSITAGTTALDKALVKAYDVCAAPGAQEDRERVCVVVTDGEDFSKGLSGVVEKLVQKNMHIFTLGVGTTQGAPVPCFDAKGAMIGHQKDEHGSVVLSKLNEKLLHDIAQKSGAFYCRMTNDQQDITHIASALAGFKKHAYANKKHTRYREYYYYPAGLSLVWFAIAWIL